jgi:hypothetical protein
MVRARGNPFKQKRAKILELAKVRTFYKFRSFFCVLGKQVLLFDSWQWGCAVERFLDCRGSGAERRTATALQFGGYIKLYNMHTFRGG